MRVMATIAGVREAVRAARCEGRRVGFVPTMGALHEGHLSLMRLARRWADRVVVSIFVNPTQFGAKEDLSRYPRPLERDLELCRSAGVDGVFAPEVEEMYPPGEVGMELSIPGLTDVLEGAFRPGHFGGVMRVVAKLLNMVEPDVAVWGRKDYQQCCVVDAMMRDLAMPIRNVVLPTVREADGLAMSSRNAYLSAEERPRATALFKALREAKGMVEREGETDPAVVEGAMRRVIEAHRLTVDYAVVRHPRTLGELDCLEPRLTGGVVGLVAARLGSVRLIDNVVMGAEEESR